MAKSFRCQFFRTQDFTLFNTLFEHLNFCEQIQYLGRMRGQKMLNLENATLESIACIILHLPDL